jgi:hypothetical protein
VGKPHLGENKDKMALSSVEKQKNLDKMRQKGELKDLTLNTIEILPLKGMDKDKVVSHVYNITRELKTVEKAFEEAYRDEDKLKAFKAVGMSVETRYSPDGDKIEKKRSKNGSDYRNYQKMRGYSSIEPRYLSEYLKEAKYIHERMGPDSELACQCFSPCYLDLLLFSRSLSSLL